MPFWRLVVRSASHQEPAAAGRMATAVPSLVTPPCCRHGQFSVLDEESYESMRDHRVL